MSKALEHHFASTDVMDSKSAPDGEWRASGQLDTFEDMHFLLPCGAIGCDLAEVASDLCSTVPIQ